MSEQAPWRIEDQPAAYQAQYWRVRAEQAEAALKAERRRKAPETLAELEREAQTRAETIRMLRADVETWKKIGTQAFARVDALEREGAAAVLKRERDHWRAQWRNATRRLGNAIEHLGMDHLGEEPDRDGE